MKNLCAPHDDCTYNENDGTCTIFDCTDLNSDSSDCEARDSCGHYDYENSVCSDEAGIPAYTNDCTVLDGWKVACEAESDCEYTVATKKCTDKETTDPTTPGNKSE